MNIYNQINSNKWKTWLIMSLFTVFVALFAYILGEANGVGISYVGVALIFSGIASFSSYYWSDKVVLAMTGARPAIKQQDFDFFTVSENIAIAAGIPMPKLYVIEDAAINAFATGRDPEHAVVVATTGTLQKLSRSELEGVIAHEISHVKNFDIRLMAVVSVLVGVVVFLGDMYMRHLWWGGGRRDNNRGNGIFLIIGIVLSILAPIVATIIQLAISRRREYLADASGALLTRNPDGLADALTKIAEDHNTLHTASNATAHLFIANPFKGKSVSSWLASLFNTHPPLDERIKILRAM